MSNQLLTIISDPNVAENDLAAAVRRLGAPHEPAEFWRGIATDPTYRPAHRRLAVFQLFLRHVTSGMKLSEVAKVLDNPDWVRDEDIIVIQDVGGFIPVRLLPSITAFALVLRQLSEKGRGDSAIYLSVSGQVERGDFIALLRGRKVADSVQEAVLNEIGMIPPPEDAILKRDAP